MEQKEKSKKSKYIKDYLKIYFDEWLIIDIENIVKMIKVNNEKFTLPPILLVSAGIDFLGGLECGFSSNSGCRSRKFIKDWMGRFNNLYIVKGMSECIYSSVRCGSSHQATYKKGVVISSKNNRKNHLHVNTSSELGDRIFIHALQFSEDFIKAQRIFRDEYISKNIDKVYRNLKEMVGKPKKEDLNDLIKYLKSNNLKFGNDIICPSEGIGE